MDRIDAMRTFVQVVDCASFSAAARALVLHKATVSQQVRQLEAHLGVRLLVRTTRAVAPTAEGSAFYRHALQILDKLDEAESVMRTARSGASGLLRVEVPVAIGRLLLVPNIRSFLDLHPRVRLELGCTDRRADLVKEGIDCAVRGGQLPDSSLVSRSIGSIGFGLYASPAYLQRYGTPTSLGDLTAHTRVGYMPAGRGELAPLTLRRGEERVIVEMPVRFVTTDSGAVYAAGVDGAGIFAGAAYVAAPALATGQLVRVLPDWEGDPMVLQLVTPASKHRLARVQAFMDFTVTTLEQRLGPELVRAPGARR